MAKAMSVAVGTAQPLRSGGAALKARKIRAGATTPPSAAITGSSAWRGWASAPECISRRISMPTTRKNTLISASLTQKCRDCDSCHGPRPTLSGVCHSAS